jgi:hypothetical protein
VDSTAHANIGYMDVVSIINCTMRGMDYLRKSVIGIMSITPQMKSVASP